MPELLNTKRPRILVTDDDHLLTAVAAMALQTNGFEVDEAFDGAIALSLLQKFDYDLVVLDLEMPNISGFQVIEEMRAHPRLQNVPIIVVTSRADPIALEKSYDLGATSFVVKPIKWNVMMHHIRYAIRNSEMAAELRVAKCEADRASKLKGDLLSLISHEFRTPIHIIQGYSRLIEQKIGRAPADNLLRDDLGEITRASLRLNAILADILFVSSSVNGTNNLREDDYRISDLIGDMVKTIASQRNKYNIKFASAELHDDFELLCDKDLLLRASRHIFDNAFKFSPKGSTITLEANLNKQGELKFSIGDQGPGMSDTEIENAFRPFSQNNMSSTRSKNGLGMGLTVAKIICDEHGGYIEICSAPNGGTEVSLIFPAHRVTQFNHEQNYEVA